MDHPLGEYSEQRFRGKHQRVPSFQVAEAKSHAYSGNKSSAMGLFIHYAAHERCYFIPVDLRARLKAFVLQPDPLNLENSETLEGGEALMMRLTEREAMQEVVVLLRTIEQARIQVSEKTALPSTAALRLVADKLAGGDFYPWGEKKNKWDQEIGPIKAFAGMSEFRLTPLGAYVLGIDAAYRPVAIASDVALSVLPSLQVNVVHGTLAAEEVLLLENWAVPVHAGSWWLDRIAELQGFLESRDNIPLPELVESFIRQCTRNGRALKTVASAVLIECRDNETAEAIAGHEETGSLCLRAGPKTLVVRTDDLGQLSGEGSPARLWHDILIVELCQ